MFGCGECCVYHQADVCIRLLFAVTTLEAISQNVSYSSLNHHCKVIYWPILLILGSFSLYPVLKSLFQGFPVNCELPLADKFARHDGGRRLRVVWKRLFIIRYCKIKDIETISKLNNRGRAVHLKNRGRLVRVDVRVAPYGSPPTTNFY